MARSAGVRRDHDARRLIGDCAQFRGLPEAINTSVFLVPRLTRDELQRSIEEPVRRQNERIAPRLVSRLLDDVGSDADQGPVLEHALDANVGRVGERPRPRRAARPAGTTS